MKIISASNFNDESVSDELIAENVKDSMAEKIAKLLNDETPIHSFLYYRVVKNYYKLYEFKP